MLKLTFLLTAVFLLCMPLAAHADQAKKLYKSGQKAEAREDYDAAFENYQKAWSLKPDDLAYKASYYRVRLTASTMHVSKGQKLEASGDQQGALEEFMHALAIDPSNEAAQQGINRLRRAEGQQVQEPEKGVIETHTEQAELDSIGSPQQLKPLSSEPLTLHMTEDAKVVYQAIGRAAGVNVLFDPEYISKRIQVDLNNVSLMDALRIVATLSGTFWRPVTSNTIFVASNTQARHRELDEQAVQTFYLTNAWQQNDLNDVQTALRNVLASNVKVYAVASQNAIVMRGTPDELLLAQKLINDLDKPRPEVVVDVAVLEVSKNWERTLGIAWPSSVGVALQTSSSNTSTNSGSTTTTTSTTTNPTIYDLAHLKASNFAVSVGTATANLLLSDSSTQILQNPRIRATDGQKASLKIGSRIPIATGSYQTGAATALVSSLVNTQFQYQDVGVNIEVTPTVHFDDDITLKVKIEVTAQSGSVTISGVTEPILSQRVAEQVVRLREGEANILGGINEKQIQESWSGIPGLSSIPILRYLFGSKDHTINNDQIVFMLIPHIVRQPSLTPLNLRSIDTGAGNTIELRHISNAGGSSSESAQPASAPKTPASGNRSFTGTVPGQTAAAAAKTAIAQMNQEPPPGGAPPPPTAAPAQSPLGTRVSLVEPSGTISTGSTFQVPIVLTGGTDIASVPMQVTYNPAHLSLVNVDKGDLLGRDGKDVTLLHRDDPPGTLVVNAARPPGSGGVSGAGVVCVLTFQAKEKGDTPITISRAGAMNSAQQAVQVQAGQISVSVQ
ncbi:MAG: type II and III secretion system protein [Acidobacteriota bacterium]|nr:type II and III secretion system protein [Acidobacteriota bacterium]